MAYKRILPTNDVTGVDLDTQEFMFVVEYLKDFNQRRAAKAAGYRGIDANELLERPKIGTAINYILQQRLSINLIDTDWLIQELVDNHLLARQDGKISASTQALTVIGKLASVDAFAAEKVQVTNASDVVERLQRARKRQAPTPPDFS